ncbi:MAG: AI-2E family transporter [Acidobacteria bacterium]|nr:MAG: AI-2E family transporter [Acidobacteriota bacterium]GIK78153.1 MAG: AI-2E family transporter [Actinomycetes bacterium]
MDRVQIDSRAVFRIVAVTLLTIAAAALLGLVVVEVETTIRWLVTAIFLALVLAPAVELIGGARIRGRRAPRWLAILVTFGLAFTALAFIVLSVIPPMVDEVERVGSLGPEYVRDAEEWANDDERFRDLNAQYHLTATLKSQASGLPGEFSSAAGELESFTVGLLKHLVSAVSVVVLAFFLLLEGPRILDRVLAWIGGRHEQRGREIAAGIYGVVRGYVTVNLALAIAAGLFAWAMLEALGVDLAVPLAILVALLDLVPLIGLTIGGVVVALVAALHSFPDAMVVWILAFLAYQQVQDRVVQPLLYGRAVRVNPLIAIVVLFMGAQIAGILGALIAIPVAASIAVVFKAYRPQRGDAGTEPAVAGDAQPA